MKTEERVRREVADTTRAVERLRTDARLHLAWMQEWIYPKAPPSRAKEPNDE